MNKRVHGDRMNAQQIFVLRGFFLHLFVAICFWGIVVPASIWFGVCAFAPQYAIVGLALVLCCIPLAVSRAGRLADRYNDIINALRS